VIVMWTCLRIPFPLKGKRKSRTSSKRGGSTTTRPQNRAPLSWRQDGRISPLGCGTLHQDLRPGYPDSEDCRVGRACNRLHSCWQIWRLHDGWCKSPASGDPGCCSAVKMDRVRHAVAKVILQREPSSRRQGDDAKPRWKTGGCPDVRLSSTEAAKGTFLPQSGSPMV
jgi:hypothetical protein